MMKKSKALIAAATLTLLSGLASAQTTPVGLWKTIDDDGKTEKSLVRISEANGVLTGTIEKVFDASKQDAKCDQCSGDRKDKPVVGLQIIRGIKQDADDKALWGGGDIVDPNNGKVYKARLKPIDGGKKLEMRGYVGAPMFGRTQTWVRVE